MEAARGGEAEHAAGPAGSTGPAESDDMEGVLGLTQLSQPTAMEQPQRSGRSRAVVAVALPGPGPSQLSQPDLLLPPGQTLQAALGQLSQPDYVNIPPPRGLGMSQEAGPPGGDVVAAAALAGAVATKLEAADPPPLQFPTFGGLDQPLAAGGAAAAEEGVQAAGAGGGVASPAKEGAAERGGGRSRAGKPTRRGPMDEMRQLVRILVKILPQSINHIGVTEEAGGGNRISEDQIKGYLLKTLGPEGCGTPHPNWGVPGGWYSYLAELFTWAAGRVITEEEAKRCAKREPGRSWEALEAEMEALGVHPNAWPLPLTKEGVAAAEKDPQPQPIPQVAAPKREGGEAGGPKRPGKISAADLERLNELELYKHALDVWSVILKKHSSYPQQEEIAQLRGRLFNGVHTLYYHSMQMQPPPIIDRTTLAAMAAGAIGGGPMFPMMLPGGLSMGLPPVAATEGMVLQQQQQQGGSGGSGGSSEAGGGSGVPSPAKPSPAKIRARPPKEEPEAAPAAEDSAAVAAAERPSKRPRRAAACKVADVVKVEEGTDEEEVEAEERESKKQLQLSSSGLRGKLLGALDGEASAAPGGDAPSASAAATQALIQQQQMMMAMMMASGAMMQGGSMLLPGSWPTAVTGAATAAAAAVEPEGDSGEAAKLWKPSMAAALK